MREDAADVRAARGVVLALVLAAQREQLLARVPAQEEREVRGVQPDREPPRARQAEVPPVVRARLHGELDTLAAARGEARAQRAHLRAERAREAIRARERARRSARERARESARARRACARASASNSSGECAATSPSRVTPERVRK